ncbi:ferritin-like domain-containing protein [Sphingomonas xanthus]|uniref:PA2169 family four-helix-bundle protein n=1 Tax=Sphingomonas xanthus TaxID=2594473 RepID=A0A516ISP2_9SPHN|nr:PA2169 family four-helix-bundle protein [Sphingomonas xanthus]QDP19925.1 PA2169 family four-helix-bundle protein [Sphingomonas xanthus]
MFDSDKNGVTVLKTLTDTLGDSINGYRDAATHVESEQFRQMFIELADKRSTIMDDLQAELGRLGASADRDGTTLGHLHQSWLDFKAGLTGRDDKAVINEVERGEDYLKEKFETALKSDSLDPTVQGVIQRAYGSVREGHDRVSQIKHSLEGQPSA